MNVGTLGGFPVVAVIRPGLGDRAELVARLDGVPGSELRADLHETVQAAPAGLVARLENRLADLERLQRDTRADIGGLRAEQQRAHLALGQSFGQRDQLNAARDRVRELDEQMRARIDDQQPAGPIGSSSPSSEPSAASNIGVDNDSPDLPESRRNLSWEARENRLESTRDGREAEL